MEQCSVDVMSTTIVYYTCSGMLGHRIPVDTSTASEPRPSLDDVSQLVFLRDRVRSLEKDILGIRGHTGVWKS